MTACEHFISAVREADAFDDDAFDATHLQSRATASIDGDHALLRIRAHELH